MKSSCLLASALGGVALFACGSPDPIPAPTTTGGASTSATSTTTTTVTSSTTGTSTVTSTATVTTTATATATATLTATATVDGSTTTGTATTDGTSSTTGGTTGAGGATATTATTDGIATTGSDSCTGIETATTPVPITPTNGWVECNAIGIQGAFFTYEDGTSSIMPEDFSATGAEICVSGTVAASAADVWGAGVGFNLNQDAGSDTAKPWDAAAAGVSGISFELSKFPDGGLMRLIYTSAGVDHCVEIGAGGLNVVAFADTAQECWDEAPGGAPAETTLEAVKWQVAAVTAEYDFEFCISNVMAVR